LRFFLTFLAITAAPTLFVLGAIPELLAAELRTTQGSHSELVNALAGEDAVARYRVEEQLVEMGDKAVVALKPLATSSGFTPARQYAIIVLARIANEKAIALLLEILEKEPDVKLRALVCTHLGRLGVEEAKVKAKPGERACPSLPLFANHWQVAVHYRGKKPARLVSGSLEANTLLV